VHYDQPLGTLVGGGRAPARESARAEAAVRPQGATWIREAATAIDPDAQTVSLASGVSVGYDFLVVCPGIALDWDRLPGAALTLGDGGVSSNYQFDLALPTPTRRRCAIPGTATCSAWAMPAPRRTPRPARRSGSRRRSW
jgi:sulfide:quinone oxidoreductase